METAIPSFLVSKAPNLFDSNFSGAAIPLGEYKAV